MNCRWQSGFSAASDRAAACWCALAVSHLAIGRVVYNRYFSEEVGTYGSGCDICRESVNDSPHKYFYYYIAAETMQPPPRKVGENFQIFFSVLCDFFHLLCLWACYFLKRFGDENKEKVYVTFQFVQVIFQCCFGWVRRILILNALSRIQNSWNFIEIDGHLNVTQIHHF